MCSWSHSWYKTPPWGVLYLQFFCGAVCEQDISKIFEMDCEALCYAKAAVSCNSSSSIFGKRALAFWGSFCECSLCIFACRIAISIMLSWWCTFCCWPHLKQVWPTLKACLGFVSVSALKQTWKTIIRCACPFNLIVLEYHFLEKIFWEESFGKPFYWKTVLLEKHVLGNQCRKLFLERFFGKS